jgi:hypothetical protein
MGDFNNFSVILPDRIVIPLQNPGHVAGKRVCDQTKRTARTEFRIGEGTQKLHLAWEDDSGFNAKPPALL